MTYTERRAVRLTRIGLGDGRDYEYIQKLGAASLGLASIKVSVLSVSDNSKYFIVFSDSGRTILKKEFDKAQDAAYAFATTVWKLMGK